MDDLIKALQILRKYGNPEYPTCCAHDVLYVCIDWKEVSNEDIKELAILGFHQSDTGGFESFKFGSA